MILDRLLQSAPSSNFKLGVDSRKEWIHHQVAPMHSCPCRAWGDGDRITQPHVRDRPSPEMNSALADQNTCKWAASPSRPWLSSVQMHKMSIRSWIKLDHQEQFPRNQRSQRSSSHFQTTEILRQSSVIFQGIHKKDKQIHIHQISVSKSPKQSHHL